jgi:hypothetical protein
VVAGQWVGYIRVSSLGQNPDRQLDGVETMSPARTNPSIADSWGLSALLPETVSVNNVSTSSCTRWIAWPATSTICVAWCVS